MSNVAPIKIDTTDGRLPIKDKGLVFQEFANPAEERSCLLYTSPSPRDRTRSRMPSSA